MVFGVLFTPSALWQIFGSQPQSNIHHQQRRVKPKIRKKKHKINIHKIDASHNYVRGISSKKGVKILPFNLA
jgi:hypothetical protein